MLRSHSQASAPKRWLLVAATVLGSLCSAAAFAQPHRTVIHLPELGTVLNWQADGFDALMIETAQHQWYRATFWAPCYQLPFADAIAFVTEPNGGLDEYSSILAGGQRCWFENMTKMSSPPKNEGRHPMHRRSQSESQSR
jgi:hypothetical protein